MESALEFGRYEDYLARFEEDSGGRAVERIEDASSGWELRRHSPAEFQRMTTDRRGQWAKRLEMGYDREKSLLADEIEALFLQFFPLLINRREEAA